MRKGAAINVPVSSTAPQTARRSGVRVFQGGVNYAEGGVAIMPKEGWEAGRRLA
jgi:hypothetical protein